MQRKSEITSSFDPLDGIIAEYLQAREVSNTPDRESLLARYPDHAERLRGFFRDFDAVGQDASKFRLPSSSRTAETILHDKASPTQLPKIQYLGDYELLSEIARGGMGVVYRARQVSLNRPVAVKMILAGTYATLEAVQRFRAEAEAAANLDHPNILPIYEVGEHEGHQYFSMKLVEGGSLSSKIDELKSNPQQIAELMATVARAVHFAHQRGILHRDLKPANVLMDADGTPYVTDFGLAKKVDADDGSTRTGSIVGTPSYMAPEQARGEKGLTTSVDVYSLGAILYEMLTGQPPFKGETIFETVKQVMEMEARDPRSINPSADRDLSVIALKCLEKNPERRYASASDLAEDLERYLQDEPIMARPLSLTARSWRWLRNHTGSILVLLCLGTLWGLSCAIWTVGASKGQQERFWPDLLLHPMGLAKWYRTSDFAEYFIIGTGLSLTVLGGWLVVALTRPRDSANAAGLGASLGLLSAVVYFLVLSPFVAVEVRGVFEKDQIHPLSADLSLARKKYVWVGEKMVETQLVAEQQELDYLQKFRTDPPRPEDPKWQESISTDRYFAVRVILQPVESGTISFGLEMLNLSGGFFFLCGRRPCVSLPFLPTIWRSFATNGIITRIPAFSKRWKSFG